MIVNIGPILIALGAGLFLGEGIPRWLAIGAGVAFLGVILIGIGTGRADGGLDRRGALVPRRRVHLRDRRARPEAVSGGCRATR